MYIMKSNKALWAALIAALAMMAIFGGYRRISQNDLAEGRLIVVTDEESAEEAIEARLGDILEVRLRNRASAGFQSDQPIFDSTHLSLLGNRVELPESSMPGNSGRDIWSFKIVASGESNLVFTGTRPWKGGETATFFSVRLTSSD